MLQYDGLLLRFVGYVARPDVTISRMTAEHRTAIAKEQERKGKSTPSGPGAIMIEETGRAQRVGPQCDRLHNVEGWMSYRWIIILLMLTGCGRGYGPGDTVTLQPGPNSSAGAWWLYYTLEDRTAYLNEIRSSIDYAVDSPEWKAILARTNAMIKRNRVIPFETAETATIRSIKGDMMQIEMETDLFNSDGTTSRRGKIAGWVELAEVKITKSPDLQSGNAQSRPTPGVAEFTRTFEQKPLRETPRPVLRRLGK